jgi:hypothetical protein
VLLILTHTSKRLWAAFAIVAFALLAAVLLWLCARGLQLLRPSASSPVLLVQFLALPVGYSLGFQAGRQLIAIPILVAAIAVIGLLLSRPSRRALDRSL